jgi:peptidoglycan hydrolase FlgJ
MIEPTQATTAALSPEEARLRRACAQMEGVFLSQLMKAMRETIPQGGVVNGGSGEDMFTAMMDEHVSDAAASQQERGLGAALFRQLRDAFLASDGPATTDEPAAAAPSAGAAAALDATNGVGTGA